MEKITIAETTPEQIPDIARIRKETWLDTFVNEEAGITREDILSEDFESAEIILGWQEYLSNPNTKHFVAKEGERIVGFAIAKQEEDNNRIKALYILPEYQGRGIGHELMGKMLVWLGTEKEIKLLAASFNQNAIAFYEKFGFKKGERVHADPEDFLPSGKEIPEIEMVKKF